ncbi:hypothetical protein E4T56_gene12493 [Termitomyces sp. T112]|nr:hypothetical protein E4T56_gene12493 [Termitomyces sp. T112]
MARRQRCPTCGSRQWHKEPSSGLIACSEGHVLQNYRNEATETEDMGHHTLWKRTMKSGRKKKEAESKANPLLYHGARGRYLYFECLQLMLRKQVAVLMKLWALPQEFEIVCRDIWALHLELLPDPPTAEPYRFAQELRDDEDDDEGGSEKTDAGMKGEESGEEIESEDESHSDEEDEQEEKSRDEELEALLRANSDLEDSSDDEDGEKPPKPAGRMPGRRRGYQVYESPESTIAVLIVGCWTLRIPVLCRDFTRVIESYKLPYLDPIQRQLLPKSMVVHLTKHTVQALSPYHAPSTQVLYRLSSRLSKMMYTSFGSFTPEANAAPILWRVVSQGLGGTPMLYRLTKRLGQILSLPLTLHHTLAPALEKRRTYKPERHVYDNVAPEVSLMAVAIIVLKMVYGLDGRPRRPRDGSDVACGLVRADEFLTGLENLEKEEEGQELNSRIDVDVSIEMIDAYFDFSERVLIGNGDGGRERNVVLERFFPVVPGMTEQRAGDGMLSGQREGVVDVEGAMGPGEGYRMYRGHDVGGTMGREWAAVVGRGARWTGVGVEAMSAVVESYERRLARWRPRAADVIAS